MAGMCRVSNGKVLRLWLPCLGQNSSGQGRLISAYTRRSLWLSSSHTDLCFVLFLASYCTWHVNVSLYSASHHHSNWVWLGQGLVLVACMTSMYSSRLACRSGPSKDSLHLLLISHISSSSHCVVLCLVCGRGDRIQKITSICYNINIRPFFIWSTEIIHAHKGGERGSHPTSPWVWAENDVCADVQ